MAQWLTTKVFYAAGPPTLQLSGINPWCGWAVGAVWGQGQVINPPISQHSGTPTNIILSVLQIRNVIIMPSTIHSTWLYIVPYSNLKKWTPHTHTHTHSWLASQRSRNDSPAGITTKNWFASRMWLSNKAYTRTSTVVALRIFLTAWNETSAFTI